VRGLYAILDLSLLASAGIEPLAFARSVLAVKPVALQVRAKAARDEEIVALLRALRAPCDAAGCHLVCNDRPDLAALAGAGFVHLGQTDMPIAEVRLRWPRLGIGISTHDLAQLERALDVQPDYVAYGPVFATRSKANPDPVVGIEGLAAAADVVRAHAKGAAAAAACPLVAIGGIDRENARDVAPHANAGAVIAELLRGGEGEIESRARALHRALGGEA
jgi:thiamine-phosphate pyrophosphorylase